MPASKRAWRLFPPPGIEHQVEQLARRENRSLANMCVRLIGEALDNRRITSAAQNGEVKELVAMLTAPASVAPAEASC
jgi:hypothetical protein